MGGAVNHGLDLYFSWKKAVQGYLAANPEHAVIKQTLAAFAGREITLEVRASGDNKWYAELPCLSRLDIH